ncbi:AAA family ATPase [Mycobacterium fragae]|uniref:Cyclase n=1 Tax=Mycobacterium fragae TaxID=1260918 RepID=A0A1X1UJT1_9MYCO|nr:adenylate/guanylate cyclase domain-containing protein [Mycobacterium fragae]MCV7400941.1 AAA family ATPase [Mycobacterium fragae]ORV57083.1 cyclase [Mycobacterium fragae]
MTAVELMCPACGTGLPPRAKFCNECGAAVSTRAAPAEYKQVTVLFADVVHSMDIAAAVGAERLREIMTELVERASSVVQRYGGTVDKFTGDGIMALFGAPVALEDHAFRACLAALEIQERVKQLSGDFEARDGVTLQLRIGLNSGEVIAGEIGSNASYTAIGEQVGMAQRMESVAPPGGVLLSSSTVRLVEHATVLGEPELVRIKGAETPVAVRRLLATAAKHSTTRRESTLVGRTWELNTVTAILDEALNGAGGVISLLGPPGIGKSRLAREVIKLANRRGVEAFTTYCESHTSDVPFHAVAQLSRAGFGLGDLDDAAARAHVRAQVPGADPDDLLLLDDLLGIADPEVALPNIEADARRRRLTALINASSLARRQPALYVIEDAHWIDDISEAMLANFLLVVPRTRSIVLITYRPEYQGALAKFAEAQTIALRPLSNAQTWTLTSELLGSHSSVGVVAAHIVDRAAGNPFFTEEIVRDLAERGVLDGHRGCYTLSSDTADVSVPATLHATIAARIDRLELAAKKTLSAAAIIGSRFSPDLLTHLGINPTFDALVEAELIDQVQFTPGVEYAFRHPLIRTVAYESQLKADRAELHRRLADVIEARAPGPVEEQAALIAEHLEAAGDLQAAFTWHMRAGNWLTNRDIAAARTSWRRARDVADRLPADIPGRTAMRIEALRLLCTSTFRGGESLADSGFDELRDLCTATGDQVSLAIGMAGVPVTLTLLNQHRQAALLASEQARLLEAIGDPTLTVGLLHGAMTAKFHAGEVREAMRLTQSVIDLADGDVNKGDMLLGSPLAQATMLRGLARCCLGIPGWKDDFDEANTLARNADAVARVIVAVYPYYIAVVNGALQPDVTALTRAGEMVQIAEQSGDDFTLSMARSAYGATRLLHAGADDAMGWHLLALARESALRNENRLGVLLNDVQIAAHKTQSGEINEGIEMFRAVLNDTFENGEMIIRGPVTANLVESLLRRGTQADLREAQAAIERLAAVAVDPGFVLFELPLLKMRALLAHAHGDEVAYRDFADRYRAMATSLGFEGHMAWAEAMA